MEIRFINLKALWKTYLRLATAKLEKWYLGSRFIYLNKLCKSLSTFFGIFQGFWNTQRVGEYHFIWAIFKSLLTHALHTILFQGRQTTSLSCNVAQSGRGREEKTWNKYSVKCHIEYCVCPIACSVCLNEVGLFFKCCFIVTICNAYLSQLQG